jgi:hypothetical protein
MTIAPPPRRLILEILLSGAAGILWLSYAGKIHIFIPSSSATDTAMAADYLLSTEVETLGSIFAITVAVLFLAAQVYTRPNYARAVTEVYRDRVTWLVLSIFVLSIVTGIVTLASVAALIVHHRYFLLDWNICLAVLSVCLLLVLTASQIANMNPYILATKLVHRISVRKIVEYNLSEVEYDKRTRAIHYKLHVYGYQHGREDPLAPFHEIVLWSVQNRDRVAMSALIRLLLSRIADAFGVPYRLTPGRVSERRRHIRDWGFRVQLAALRPVKYDDAIRVTLFILTYVVRRSQRLRDEWGGLDIVRQQYILNIRDLIISLIRRQRTDDGLRLCLFAVMHICLSYAKIQRYGEDEALRHYYELANRLASQNRSELAKLCVQIVALLKVRTTQIPSSFLVGLESAIHPILQFEYQSAVVNANGDQSWLPGSPETDPWRYRAAAYPLEPEPHRIILT